MKEFFNKEFTFKVVYRSLYHLVFSLVVDIVMGEVLLMHGTKPHKCANLMHITILTTPILH